MCPQVKVENQVSFGIKEDITIGFGMSPPRTSKGDDTICYGNYPFCYERMDPPLGKATENIC